MKPSAIAALAGLIGLTASAFAVDGVIGEPKWRSDWRKHRNTLIETVADLKVDPTSIVVKFEDGVDPAKRDAIKIAAGLRVEPIETWEILPGVEHLMVIDGDSIGALEKLKGMPFIVYAEHDFIVRTCVTPNDPNFGVLWGMNNTGQTVNGDPGVANADINAPEAWNLLTGSANFVIADIDTGVNYSHPDLAANSWINPGEIAGNGVDDDGNGRIDDMRGWDFYNNDNDPMDDNGHGTHTSGTFGGVGNNGVGVAGVAWNCKIMGLKFLGGSGGGSTTGAISAVQYLTQKSIKVSNNSWGGGGFSQALFDAIAASRNVGHVFVAAAGNSGANIDSAPTYPASYNIDNIISVAASDNNDQRASFTNYGVTSVDLAAPGVNIYSTYLSGYDYLDGTSMATPHVAGAVALVQIQNPSWTYSQVRSRILTTTRAVPAWNGAVATGGVLNLFAALNTGGPTNTPPTVNISAPSNGGTFADGATVTFTGTASDPEDGSLTSSIVWTSSLQGSIGTGGTFSRTLNSGTHTIVATATDSGTLAGSASVTITVGTPSGSNDNCAGALALTNGVVSSGSTVGSTTDGSASCGGTFDMWYRYTTTGTTTMTVDTCGSSFDTMIAVFTGSCGSLAQVACNDDAGANGPCPNGLMSYVSFTPTANTTYMIRVSGYNGATGSFNVRASGGVGNSNTPPTVAISAPTNGATFANGATITFTGSASDTQDGSLTSAIAWTSSVQGSIGTGGTFSRTLNAGAHTITATVTDSGGLTSTSSVSITVQSGGGGLNNETCASAIAITNGVAVSGTNVGAVNDATASCGGSLDVWYRYTATGSNALTFDTCGSGFDTQIAIYTGTCGALTEVGCNDDNGGTGPCPGGLTSHVTLTATANTTYYIRVSGYAGRTGTFNIRATGGASPNTAPSVSVTSPTNGSTHGNGATISFTGSATDAQDGSLTGSIAWTSSLQGAIGTGGTFSRTLNPGTHAITATVTDSGGLTGTSTVNITVLGASLPNDMCSTPIALVNGTVVSATNAGATTDGAASCGGTNGGGNDLWYRIDSTSGNPIEIDTCGSALDTVVSVHTGSCGSLTQIACNDDNGGAGPCPGGLTTYLSFTPTPGVSYMVRVAGYASTTGNFNLRYLQSGCLADFNGDGTVDGDDVIGFFAAWDGAAPAADMNGDGTVDGDDVIIFFARWDAGC